MIVEKLKAIFTLDSSGFTSGMEQAVKSMNSAKRDLEGLNVSTKTLGRSITEMAGTLGLAGGALATIGGSVAGLTIKIAEMSSEIDGLSRGLSFASGGALEGSKSFDFLEEATNKLGISLRKSIKAFTGMAAAAKGTVLEGSQVQEIYLAITEASAVLGLSASQTELSLFAVQQMMSKGTISAEELTRQLGEHMPIAITTMAESLGVSVARLKEMVQTGGLLSSVVLPKFASQLRSNLKESVEEASTSLRASLGRLENAWFLAKKEIFSAKVNNELQKALEGITETIEMLPDLWKYFEGAVLGSIRSLEKFFSFMAWGWKIQFDSVSKLKKALSGLGDGISGNLIGIGNEALRTSKDLNSLGKVSFSDLNDKIEEVHKKISGLSRESRKALEIDMENIAEKVSKIMGDSLQANVLGKEISKVADRVSKIMDDSMQATILGKDISKVTDRISSAMEKEIEAIEKSFSKRFGDLIFDIEQESISRNVLEKKKMKVKEFYRDQLEVLTKGSEREIALTRKYNDLLLMIDKRANELILEEAERTAKELQQINDEKFMKTFGGLLDYVQNVTTRITDSFVELSLGGKVSFKDLVDSIIGDLQRLIYKVLVVEPIVKSFMELLKSSDGGGLLGTVVGAVKSVFGFADGGVIKEPVMGVGLNSGAGYSFGERGPEAILPLGASEGQGLSQGGVFNITINSVDSKSFSDLVNRNPNAILNPIVSALESGNRGLSAAMRGVM